ncbi:3-oxo-tetronate kinase [Vibrio sonorensis]|uniref:3-oxo-tetronate kinase n=1 Tax=Vibrio sonorensis TaxID=1004316 RepID=UPI0008D9A374|nr:3-oxo-tetronate kinase [Vibrio sonorensis]
MKIGVIADDYTGATDAASFIVKNGLPTVQFNQVPNTPLGNDKHQAVVIGLKTRSCETSIAIEQSINACRWLLDNGCQRIYFKYCSTFDSTKQGNIGPVIDALMEYLNVKHTLLCPALPINGRTVYQGHLFVYDQLLNESGMKNHPLTPMRDCNLVRLTEAQSKGAAVSVSYPFLSDKQTLAAQMEQVKQSTDRYILCDALDEHHLHLWGEIASIDKLATGGSGLVGAIAKHLSASLEASTEIFTAPKSGKGIVLSGSCSLMTNQQVNHYSKLAPSYALDVERCIKDAFYAKEVIEWVMANSSQTYFPMVYATVDSKRLRDVQKKWGKVASEAVENVFSDLVKELKELGFNQFITAGGETSGTVTQALEINSMEIGAEIAPGVPWVRTLDHHYYLALKSGNFGQETFFLQAQEIS